MLKSDGILANELLSFIFILFLLIFIFKKFYFLKFYFNFILEFLDVVLGSLFLGSFIGCANSLITKLTVIHEFPLLESALFILLSYLSFLLAEFVQLTGFFKIYFQFSKKSNNFLYVYDILIVK